MKLCWSFPSAALSLLFLVSKHSDGFLTPPMKKQAAASQPLRRDLYGDTRAISSMKASSMEDLATKDASASFDWKTAWYPLAPVQDLALDSPNKFTLLGMDLAVWYHSPSQTWRVFRDLCPHRLVPLSEGRVEPGVLQCAYHGWEFDGSGNCVVVPQLAQNDTAAVNSPRACATNFPACEKQGLLWVFPTVDADLAASKELPLIPELDDPDKVDATNFFVRDMPYSWEILVENLCDPAHIPFAHHSMMKEADRNSPNQIDLEIVDENNQGFLARKDPYPSPPGKYDLKFQPPCLLYYTLVDESAKSYVGLGQYCVPTAPGKCRLLARFPFRLNIKPAMAAIRMTPRWITHLSQNLVMDSDVIFLCAQDEFLQNQKQLTRTMNKAMTYYMPARCDTAVMAFRRWLSRHDGPEWLGIPASRSDGQQATMKSKLRTPPAKSGRDDLLDRYRQHTDSCTSCRRAYEILHRLREASFVCGVGLIAAAAGSFRRRVLTALLGASLCLLVPRVFLQPLISRLEGMPWPRENWRKASSPKNRLHLRERRPTST